MLCTFNGERFLEAQIDSLLQQTYANIEIIVSDDGSVDGTKAILQSYEHDPRFHITFQAQNLGTIHNFEYATNLASGEYIAFCDQDDVWLPEKIEKLFHAIGDHLLVYCDSMLIDEEGKHMQKNLSHLRKMGNVTSSHGFIFSNVAWGHAMMIKKELLPHVLPIPYGIPHDIWFAFRATTLTGITYLDEPLTLYRQHSQTVTTTIATKTGTRSNDKRFKDFQDKLNWITLMRDHAPADEKEFYSQLQQLYARKKSGKKVWPLYHFMMKYRKELFAFTNKNFLSQWIEIHKQSRGEKA